MLMRKCVIIKGFKVKPSIKMMPEPEPLFYYLYKQPSAYYCPKACAGDPES